MIWCIRGSRYSVLHKMTRPEIRSILRAGDKNCMEGRIRTLHPDSRALRAVNGIQLEGAYEVETERGRIKALEGNKTSVEGIFAGGDVTTGPATVIKAIAAGKDTPGHS